MSIRARAAAVVLAAGAAAAALAGCGSGVAVTRAGTSAPASAPAPTFSAVPATSAAAVASSSTASGSADRCSGRSFGPPLAARDQPADVHSYPAPPAMQIDPARLYEATITTARGRIVLCLDPALAPHTVNNFVVLARNHFYDGLTFHRVVADFVIQGGDPLGDGSGGPGYEFADEPVKGAYTVGSVAMANAGPNTNGSQFFICIGSGCAPLPPSYNLFGSVHAGEDVAGAVQQGDVMSSVTVAESTS